MALTLAESAKLSQDTLAKGVLETFVQTSPILDRIPFMEIAGNAYAYDEEATLPGVAFRSVNEAYAESTGSSSRPAATSTTSAPNRPRSRSRRSATSSRRPSSPATPASTPRASTASGSV